jgi:hypothetical protein
MKKSNGGKITNLKEYKAWLQLQIDVCMNNARFYMEAGERGQDLVTKYHAYADTYRDALKTAQEIE